MDAQYQSDDDVLERLEPDTPIPKNFQDETGKNPHDFELQKSESEESEISPDPVHLEPSHNTARFKEQSMDIEPDSQISTQKISMPHKLPGIAIIGESPGTSMLKIALQHCGFPIIHYLSESNLIMLKSAEASSQNSSNILSSVS